FLQMEKKVDTTGRAVLDIMTKITEYLQPNPASRAKLSLIGTMSKIRGQEKGMGYPQAETLLGEAMQHFGRELGEQSCFGLALLDAGEAMGELGEVKDALDMEVKQNCIDPLQNLQEKDIKEIQVDNRTVLIRYRTHRKNTLKRFDLFLKINLQKLFNFIWQARQNVYNENEFGGQKLCIFKALDLSLKASVIQQLYLNPNWFSSK
uniref:BAR domain-containing protein n=1 Tax=Hucho hucho TaxID=62062 RepID=A0A4W5JSZ7_9TELE